MTLAIAFILGLTLGIGFYYWQNWQYKRKLKETFAPFFSDVDRLTSLSLNSSIRRAITRIDDRRQQLEQELQIGQELLELAPIGYLRIDEENQLLWCNQQARELLKIDRWQPGKLRLLLELVRSYELDILIEQTRQTQKPQSKEWVFYTTEYTPKQKVATPQSIALKASSFSLPQRQVAVFLENQQPFVELSQSRERAFSDLTHELRTPLTAIGLVVEALQKRLSYPEKRWVEQMESEINRLINLVQGWLEISELQENPIQHLEYESIELRELIFSVWHTLEPIATQKQVSLVYSGPDRLDLKADKSRIIQVFLNLFDNGIKHSPLQGEIAIEVKIVDRNTDKKQSSINKQYIEINIIDSGSGFRESDLPHIFKRLYRGDTSRKRPSSTNSGDVKPPSTGCGSGLGLSLVKEIVQAHRGSIEAQNHPETGGGWLKLTLPLDNSQD